MESSLKHTRDQLTHKEEENDMLMRTIRARTAEEEFYEKDKSQLLKEASSLTAALVEKDTKINTLKRHLGELRKVLQFRHASKPPSSKSSHLRSQSALIDMPEEEELSQLSESQESTSNMELLSTDEISELKTALRLLDRASALECSNCARLLCKSQFGTHTADCIERMSETAETDGDLQKREYRNIIRELRAEQKILRGEVDRLTSRLRQAKVDCAVQAERSAEREHELKSQQKALVNHILTKEPDRLNELAALLHPSKPNSRNASLQSES